MGAPQMSVTAGLEILHRVVKIVGDVVEVSQNRGFDKVGTTLGDRSSVRSSAENLQARHGQFRFASKYHKL